MPYQIQIHDCVYMHSLTLSLSLSLLLSQMRFVVEPYMIEQKDMSPMMRTILVDWLIEVQENFELFHETLYLSVRLVDLYLSRREVKREFLQLVGATCLLIASKFEVRVLELHLKQKTKNFLLSSE